MQADKDKNLLKKLPNQEPKDFNQLFNETSPEGIDLLKKMLTFNPRNRISVEEALEHPFLADLHCSEDEPDASPVEAFDFDFEKYDLTKQQYKELIYAETLMYHDKEARERYEIDKKEHPEGILSLKFPG